MMGEKVILDQLSAECERMLARKVSDLVGPLPEMVEVPIPAAPEPVAAASDRPMDTPRAGSGGAETADAGGSLTERLARLEALLEQLIRQRPL
jgi:hypothetical protein